MSEADIGRYVITAWLLGRDFHELPAMRDILARRDVTAAQKTEALERVTRTVFGILNDGRR